VNETIQRSLIQLGNILRGARDTRRHWAREAAASPLVTIKTPTFLDGSHWDTISDWLAIPKSVLLLGWKATEGTNYKDPTFPEHFNKAKSILGIRRLAFHFFRKALDPVKQADWFIDYIEPYITDDDLLCLDFEEGGEKASQLWAFLNRVFQRRPNNLVINYSRKNLMDAVVMTSSERAFFKSIPSWPAGYPQDPNLFNSTPAGYIPDQTSWGPVWAWQYSDQGIVPGFNSAVDLNLMEKPLLDYIGNSTGPTDPPPGSGETVTHPYPNVEQHQGTLNGQRYFLQCIDLNGSTYKVQHFNRSLEQVQQAAQLDGADIVVNGDDYVKGGEIMPTGMSYTDGARYTPPFEARYWLNVSRSNAITWGYGQPPASAYNLTSFIRPMVVNGQLHAGVSADKIENKEIHARSFLGVDGAGRLMILICEGFVDPDTGISYAGVTLPQAAQLCKDKGAVFMGEHGGGGDAGLFSNGAMLNDSSDRDAGVGWRGVVQVIEIFLNTEGGSMPTTNGVAKEKLGKTSTVRKSPGVVSGNSTDQSIQPKSTLEYTELVIGTNSPNDRWFKLADGSGYVQYIYSGRQYYDILQEPGTVTPPPVEPPPANSGDIQFEATLHDDGTLDGTWQTVK